VHAVLEASLLSNETLEDDVDTARGVGVRHHCDVRQRRASEAAANAKADVAAASLMRLIESPVRVFVMGVPPAHVLSPRASFGYWTRWWFVCLAPPELRVQTPV
jgi:hypothetical protein